MSTTENDNETITFESFGFKKRIMQGINEAGFKVPSPIQAKAIPIIMDGEDVIGQAQTGTGKTAAFGLPTMNDIQYNSGVEILVIVPTRELATQVSDELFHLGRFAGIKTVAVYGGQSISWQMKLVNRGAQVVVATPGRLLDHLRSGRFENFEPKVVILDESDEMLDMGFLDDIETIFEYLPENRQTLLFSATMPPPIQRLAERILREPRSVKIEAQQATNKDIEQKYYIIDEHEREEAVVRLLESENPSKTIIFTRTKREADLVAQRLNDLGFEARSLHGDMEQRERQDTIKAFKSGQADLLVATDVASRGLDISGVSHVINYHIPLNPESYVHRIGRTGRAGKKGVAITLATPLEFKELRRIQKNTNIDIELYAIPSMQVSMESKENELIDSVLGQDVSDSAIELYEKFKNEIDPGQLALKLLSMVYTQHVPENVKQIGYGEDKLADLYRELNSDEEKKSRKRGRSGGRSSNGDSRRRPSGQKRRRS